MYETQKMRGLQQYTLVSSAAELIHMLAVFIVFTVGAIKVMTIYLFRFVGWLDRSCCADCIYSFP